MRNFSTFLLACLFYFILPFTDLRNFTYRIKFSLLEVEVSQKLTKEMERKNTLYTKFLHFLLALKVFMINREYYSLRCVLLPQDDKKNDIEPYMMLKHAVIT